MVSRVGAVLGVDRAEGSPARIKNPGGASRQELIACHRASQFDPGQDKPVAPSGSSRETEDHGALTTP